MATFETLRAARDIYRTANANHRDAMIRVSALLNEYVQAELQAGKRRPAVIHHVMAFMQLSKSDVCALLQLHPLAKLLGPPAQATHELTASAMLEFRSFIEREPQGTYRIKPEYASVAVRVYTEARDADASVRDVQVRVRQAQNRPPATAADERERILDRLAELEKGRTAAELAADIRRLIQAHPDPKAVAIRVRTMIAPLLPRRM